MSTLTSNANNNNNNNLIANNASSAQLSNVNNNNSPNTINNNNTNSPAGAPTATQNSHHHSHHHQYQSALASGVSRLFARSMSSASANGGAGGVGAAGSTSGGPSAVAAGGTGGGLGAAATPAIAIPAELNVMLHGYHKKLKTNKKKYFVVYGDTPDKSARLEYFDSEKKFKQSWLKSTSVQAKRSIVLRSCFNINKRHDIKKHVIALYTKDDCFCIVFDSEEELNRWLRTLLSLQRGEESEGEPPRPTFEHVWDVFVERKGLGDSCGILGTYRLCITDKTLSLVRIGPPTTNSGDARVEVVEFSLASIRRCGASQRYFYLEVGRSSKIGPGEIWMEAPDAIIAHNMHTTIMKPTKNREVDGLGPIPRNRSSSANAASKPTAMLGRRQTYTGQKPVNCSPSGEDQRSPHASHAQSSESSSSATSTNTVVMVPQNPANSSQNLKSTQNHHPNSDKPCTSISSVPAAVAVGSSGVVAGFPAAGSSQPSSNSCGHPAGVLTGSHPHPHHPSPTPSYSRSAIKKPKLAPPPEEEGSASSFRSYTSIAREPTAPGGTSSTATPPLMMMMMQHHTGPSPAGGANNVTSSTATSVVVGTNGSSGAIATTISTTSLASTSESPSPSDHAAVATCQAAVISMMLPPSPSPSMGKFHRYHQQRPPSSSSLSSSSSCSMSPNNGGFVTAAGAISGSDSSSCCSSTASIQTAITSSSTVTAVPMEVDDLPQLFPMLPPPAPMVAGAHTKPPGAGSGSSLSLAGITRHMRLACSNHSTSQSIGISSSSTSGTATTSSNPATTAASNTLFLSTIPLRRLRSSLRRHSVSGAAIARERCDSLPSRNRTTSETSTHQQQLIMNSGGMPPPRTIPSASFNRPQSMIVNRQSHSHSPPVHSSPLSPPSGACSTGSDGSSFSIDEPDSYNSSHTPDEGNGFPKVINHLSSGCSIPEENSEEYINNYGKVPLRPQHRSMDEFVSHAIRRGSPAPPANIVDNSSSSNYMEMCSPCGSSPGDPSGNSGYIPMSPSTDFPRGLYSSSAHSRTSSLAEDTVDAYVPMAAPGHNTEEYVDMDPSHNSSSNRTLAAATTASQAATTAGGNGNISSAASSCSITSGTPSTDMRFSGYHLDKVEARFTPSEDDEMERPLRTYSVGSRLEHNKRKLRVDMLSSEGSSNSRVRAFSVGSRAKVPRSDVYKGSGAPITAPLLSAGSSGSLQETSSNSGSITNCAPLASTNARGSNSSMNEGRTGKKSSSAPTLAAKPHGSFDPIMDDLMEIDYSAPQFHGEPTASSSTPQKTSGMEDYMEMTAGGGNKRNTGYVEMKPGHIPPVNTSSHENSDYLDMRPGTGYEPNPSTKSKSSPIKINSPKKFSGGGNNNNNYLEMSPRMMGTSSSSSSSMTNRKPTAPSEDYLNISPLMMTSAGGDSGNEEKMINEEEEDEEEVVAPSSAPDVYMEMTWSQPKTSLDSSKPVSDDYINMDYSRKDVSGSSSALDSRLSSMPIAIQSGSAGRTLQGDLMEPKIGGAPSNIPNYLPLNSSTTRHQGAAQIGFSPKQNSLRSRCDSRDSGIVTPSGSQVTIFPFSPGSPIKSFSLGVENPSAEERKCFVDATTGTLRISETDEDNSEESNEFLADQPQSSQPKDAAESSKLEDLSHNYAELSIGQQQQQQQTQQKTEKSHPSSFSSTKKANLSLILTTSTNTRTTPTITAMKSAVEYPDYVNCTPVTTPVVTKPTTPMAVDDQAGDYAIMNPASLRKLSSTSQSELSSTESGLPPLTKKSNQIFKPITSSQDEAFLKKPSGASPKPAFNRQYSERRVPGPSGIDSSGYEMLQRTSRPNSVNSEKITNKCPPSAGSTRPSSANSDRLPIISATSSSASSTSTLCESKNQSPTASSVMIATTTTTTVTPGVRPDSVTSLTDPHIISRPPSVSSERELHYASLDLPPCTNPPPQSAPVAGTSAVPPNSTNRMEVDSDGATAANRPGGPDSLNSSPSPNSGCTSQQQTGSAFTYAQIDFVRSVAQAQAQQQSVTKSGQQQQ
ncbi:serine-rich adhesin for platelets isoform X4 [Aedes albopictus]|uniref:Insulin receptor substrate 1 n=1 Tax=Aedes albopictus TaxID=7160 RepID=A0ABM1YN37_AEDAL